MQSLKAGGMRGVSGSLRIDVRKDFFFSFDNIYRIEINQKENNV